MGNKTHQEIYSSYYRRAQRILAKQIGRNRFNRLFELRHQADVPAALRTEKYGKMSLLKRLTSEADKLAEVKNER
ncbi:uncharacterized protein METZ01_LOCUS487735 [marine metagenome]|uniref:Uncharacterized protein n=1 Tax=marine metagenome TaxID=408172 RepID=A0A383CRX1_9ZZZZ